MSNETATLRGVLLERAAADAERLAYVERERRLTYAELLANATELACGLRSLGVREGGRVALIHTAGIRFMELFWAAQLLGAVPVAFNPYVPPATAKKRAERVRPALIVTDETDVPRLREGLPEVTTIPEDLAYLQPTSGTSGEPQAVMMRHRAVVSFLEMFARTQGVTRDDVHVGWVPPWHDLGLIRFVMLPVFSGGVSHIVQPSVRTIPEWLHTISRERGTLSSAPDFAYRLATRLVDPQSVDLSSLRFVSDGGEPVHSSTIRAFEERFNLGDGVVVAGYGMAETTLGVAMHPPGEPLHADSHGNVSCGSPLDHTIEIRIDGDAPGEILIRSPYLFAGYFDDEQATARVLRDGWLHTGDTGYLDAQGRLYVLGRIRAMLKRGGAVLAPRELEEAAQQVGGVRLAAAVGVPNGDGTEIITLVAESETPSPELHARIADAVRMTCGFAPERVLLVAPRTIPRTYNGKVRHAVLRDALVSGSFPPRN
jgi:fatty-acyl-CoA synthase